MVTPTILPKRQLMIALQVNQDKPGSANASGVPSILTQQLKTKVIINNKQTLVLGGIDEDSADIQKTGVPVLSEIPFLGALFRHKQIHHQVKQLLIFLTPEIVG